jgi:hypothetical protein
VKALNASRLDDPFYRGAVTRNILIIFALMALVLLCRLFFLQVIKGSYHEKLSDQNSMRLQIVQAPR